MGGDGEGVGVGGAAVAVVVAVAVAVVLKKCLAANDNHDFVSEMFFARFQFPLFVAVFFISGRGGEEKEEEKATQCPIKAMIRLSSQYAYHQFFVYSLHNMFLLVFLIFLCFLLFGKRCEATLIVSVG